VLRKFCEEIIEERCVDIYHLNLALSVLGSTFDDDVEFRLSFGKYGKRCNVPTSLILMATSVKVKVKVTA